MAKRIEEGMELIPGMLIGHRKNKHETFRIVFAEPFRDSVVLCIDDCGQTNNVSAWDGNYEIVLYGATKVKIAYGKNTDGKIQVSNDYYYNAQDFKDKHSEYHFWYVEALNGTQKVIKDRPRKFKQLEHWDLTEEDYKICFKHNLKPDEFGKYKLIKNLLEKA